MSAYSDAVLAEAILALYWRLGESAGTFEDQTANNRDGTNAGGVTYSQTGLLTNDADTSAGFPGLNNGRVTAAYSPFVAGSVRTFEGWAYRDTSAGEDQLFSGDGANPPRLLLGSGGQNVAFRPDNSAAGGDVTWTNAWPGNAQVVHWVLVFDDSANTAKLYINGALVSEQAATEPYGAAPGNFHLGGQSGGGSALFNGRMDEVAIYEGELSAERILYHYQVGTDTVPEPANPRRAPSDPAIRVLIGNDDVTPYVEDGLSWSNVDPGGMQAAQIPLPRDGGIKRGERVLITAGIDTVFDGRVQRVGRKLTGGAGINVSCEGAGARFKDVLIQEIWRDADLGRWRGPSAARQLRLLDLTPKRVLSEWSVRVAPDPDDGNPALAHETNRLNSTAAQVGLAASVYDAQGIAIAALYYELVSKNLGNGADANWQTQAFLMSDELFDTGFDSGTDHNGADGPTATTLTTSAVRTFAALHTAYMGTSTADGQWTAMWRRPTVYGAHGLTLRGTEPDAGFYPSDIFRDVLRRVSGIAPGIVEDATSFVVPHAVALDPTEAERIVADQALLAGGFHWGTWPNPTTFGDTPVCDFRAHPATATCHVSRADCDELDLEEDLSHLYNQASVSFTDGDGTPRTVTVTRSVAELDEAGLTRTLPVNLGEGRQAAAESYAGFLLALSERSARASGTADLSLPVGVPGGGRKPAYLLRAGIDKLRVTDLPNLPMFESGRDEFHIKRVDATVGRGGIRTKLELGLGADLIEVLHARLQLRVQAATFGR